MSYIFPTVVVLNNRRDNFLGHLISVHHHDKLNIVDTQVHQTTSAQTEFLQSVEMSNIQTELCSYQLDISEVGLLLDILP